jgi:hypothetical protein
MESQLRRSTTNGVKWEISDEDNDDTTYHNMCNTLIYNHGGGGS